MITTLTPEQERQLIVYRDLWIERGLSTNTNREKAELAYLHLYKQTKLAKPQIIWCPCPISGCLSALLIPAFINSSAVRSAVDSAVDSAVGSAVHSAVDSAVDSAVNSAVGSAVNSAVRSAVDSAVHSAVDSAVHSAVGSAVHSAVHSAVDSEVHSEVHSAVHSAVRSAVNSAVGSAVGSAVDSEVRSAVGSAVGSAVRSAVNSAVGSAVGSAVDSAVHSPVHSAVNSAVGSEVGSEVDSAVGSAVHSAVHSAVRSAVGSAVDSAVHSAVRSAVRSTKDIKLHLNNGYCYFGGSLWAAYQSYISYIKKVLNVTINTKYDDIYHAGYFFCLDRWIIATDKPNKIILDTNGQLHNETGLAIEYHSGWGLSAWHGTAIPNEWIGNHPKAKDLLKHENIEQRRAGCELIGWNKILDELKAKQINKDHPEIGTLYEADIPDSGPERFLKVRCGTGRDFVIPVPREIETARQGNAWTYDVSPKYLPEVRT
jgi:phage baseplate assembly protein W